MNTKIFNPTMLKIARQATGRTQAELCRELGKSQGTISRYEDSLIEPEETDLGKMAQILGVTIDFFFKDFTASSFPFLRAKASTSQKSLAKVKSLTDMFRSAFNRLMEEAEIKNYIPELQDKFKNYADPEECANELRSFLGLGNEPIDNLISVVESLGVFVYFYNFETTELDGLTYYSHRDYSIIYLNNNVIYGERVRFTLAHELGHLLLHKMHSFDDKEDKEIEKEAHKFASAFLMPAKAMSKYDNIPDKDLYRSLFIIKKQWKVSIQALLVRFKDLKYINAKTYMNVYKRISADGYRSKEPNPIAVEQAENVTELFKIFKENGYSVDEMVQVLGIGKNYLYRFFDEGSPEFSIISNNIVKRK